MAQITPEQFAAAWRALRSGELKLPNPRWNGTNAEEEIDARTRTQRPADAGEEYRSPVQGR